jgi:hypothetical protein
MARRVASRRKKEAPYEAPYGQGDDLLNGPPLAAVLAASIGVFALGVLTTLAEVSAGIKTWLTWVTPVGPLSGKTLVAIIAWLAAWAVLGLAWRRRDVVFRTVVIASAVLIGLGFLGTFPSFFDKFAGK